MKFGTQSLTQTPKSVVCSKIKNLKIQDGRRHHNFFFFLGLVPWSNLWTVLDEQYVITRVLAHWGDFLGSER